MELFILYDTGGSRTTSGRHVKSQGAKRRAEARTNTSATHLSKMLMSKHNDATLLPTLNEELNTFKAIVRDIMKHEASIEDGPFFKAEKRDKIRRLAGLGVLAHQPAIAAYCEVTDEEMENLTRCIMQQKTGSNAKVFKTVRELLKKSKRNSGPTGT